ncbi:methyltransferase family protein [Deinococcus hohokamensis]|uniref:Methyltransferase family protein n=1 Tax=Deinococcus hohokamensis TaxID=309883 RepID=A0ABV9I7F8_9DEIO
MFILTHSPAPALLAYFTLYVLIAFVWRSLLVWRQAGVNPYVLPTDDSAHGYVGRAMRVLMLGLLTLLLALTVVPSLTPHLGSLDMLAQPGVSAAGWALLLLSLGWVAAAQAAMGASWRIGIDTTRPTVLVQRGPFQVSRNPIFLGMRLNLLGLVLVMPNAGTLAALVAGEVLMQIQVRLEEAHLAGQHGDEYRKYTKAVPRWF